MCNAMRVRWVDMVLVLAIASCAQGCKPGFYTMYPVRLSSAVEQTKPVTTNRETDNSASPAGADPYLTISVYAHPENLNKHAVDVNHQLQILNLTASFAAPGAAIPVKAVLMSIDVKKGDMQSSGGEEFLKALPIVVSSQQSFTLTLTSSAVEENLADTFNGALRVVSSTAGPLIGAASPQATIALNMAAEILGKFESGKDGTRYIQPETLNPTAGDKKAGFISGEIRAMIIVPTGELLSQGDVTSANTGNVANETEYAERVAQLRKLRFSLCGDRNDSLCTEDQATKELKPFDDYAYLLLVPALSYRITLPTMFWPSLAVDGSCPIERPYVEKSIAARMLAAEAGRLTPSQDAMEKEVEGSAVSLLAIRDVLAASDKEGIPAALFEALDKEWHRTTPTEALYSYHDAAGPTYSDIRRTLRKCIISTSQSSQGIIVSDFTNAIASATAAIGENDLSKQISAFSSALDSLYSVKKEFERRRLDLAARLQDISTIESKLLKLQFAPLFVDARNSTDATRRAVALRELAELIGSSSCQSCRDEALKVVAEVQPMTPARDALARASEVSGRISEIRGAAVLAAMRSSNESKSSGEPTAGERIKEALTVPSQLAIEASTLSIDATKQKEAREKIQAAERELAESKTRLRKLSE